MQYDGLPFELIPTILDDFTRVVLSEPNSDGSDYINASFIDVSSCVVQIPIHNLCTRQCIPPLLTLITHATPLCMYSGLQEREQLHSSPRCGCIMFTVHLVHTATCLLLLPFDRLLQLYSASFSHY